MGPARGRPLTEARGRGCAARRRDRGLARDPRRHVRPDPPRAPRDRRGGARDPGPRARAARPGRAPAPQAGPAHHRRRAPPRDGRAGGRRQPRLRREPDGDRARRALVHGRHPGRAPDRRGWRGAPVVHPLGRGAGRVPVLARAGPDPRARPARGDAAGRGARRVDAAGSRRTSRAATDRVRFLAGPLLPISGSVVRRRVAAGRSIRYLVPDPVARYIADHALYTEPA